MYQATEKTRDQSYFLFNTTKKQLNYLRFPLGILLKEMGKSEEALISAKKAIEIEPKDAQLYLNLGIIFKSNSFFARGALSVSDS